MGTHRRISSIALESDTEEDYSLLNSHNLSESGSSIEITHRELDTSQRLLDAAYETYTNVRTSRGFKITIDICRRLLPRSASPTSKSAARSSSRTAAYDGLRGIACLIVFNFHFLYPFTGTITHGYAVEFDDRDWRYIHQLPIICLLVRGRAMVTLFFAISGYVLSYNFLAAMRSNQKTLTSFSRLSSLILRRWMRLYLPASFSMFLVCLAAYLGVYEQGRELENSPWRMGWWEQHPPHFKRFRGYIKDYARMWIRWQSPWKWWMYYSDYDPHTWTIPTEFRDSMVLFLVLLASAGLKRRWRFGLIILVTTYCLLSQRWDVATFTGGALVAEIHLWQLSSAPIEEKDAVLPTDSLQQPSTPSRSRKILISASKWLLLLTALYALSFPDDKVWKTPGFLWLNSMTPPGYEPYYDDPYQFWHAAAAIPILWSITQIQPINDFLSSSFPQYLGKISYGLYLVHGPLLHSLGFALQPLIFHILGASPYLSDARYLFSMLLGWIIMLSISLVTAHLFWKYVDMPLVRFAKYMEKIASRTEEAE